MSYLNPTGVFGQYGVANYLQNPNFDDLDAFSAQVAGASKWNAYKDTAAATPADGTGGSPTVINNAVLATGTLRRTRSWLISKTGNAQGEGYSQDFTLDAADKSMVIGLSFDYLAGSAYTAGDLAVYLYDVTNSALITPTQYAIPQGAGTFQASWAATTSTSYRIIFHCAASNVTTTNWTMGLDNIQVAPKNVVIGPGISDWQGYTPTFSAGFGTPTNVSFFWRRVGDSISVQGTLTTGTVAASLGSISLPSNVTIGTVSITNTTSNAGPQVGSYVQTSSQSAGSLVTATGSSNNVVYIAGFWANSSGGTTLLIPQNCTTILSGNQILSVIFTVPVANWSSNITFANNQTEWVFNTTTDNTNDTTSFGYGPGGALIPNRTVGTSVTKRIRFSTAIQPSDKIILEVYDPTGGIWIDFVQRIGPYVFQSTTSYGALLVPISGSTTDLDIVFSIGGDRPTNATYAGNGGAWSTYFSASWKWRVRKSAGPNALQLSGAIVGVADGSNALAGYIGEYKEATFAANTLTGSTGQFGDMATLSLSPGDWDIFFQSVFDDNAATLTSDYMTMAISAFANNTTTDHVIGDNVLDGSITVTGKEAVINVYWRRNISSTTTYHAKLLANFSAGTPRAWGKIWARRVR
jgi:hypothetical protein